MKEENIRISKEGNETRGSSTRGSFAASLWKSATPQEKFKFNMSRFIQLSVGILIAFVAGSQFCFGLISSELRKRHGFDQYDMTIISSAATFFHSLPLPGGILYDYAGPKPVLLIATIMVALGWLLNFLIFHESLPGYVLLLAFSNGICSWGYSFFDVGSVMTNLFNFPLNKGEVVIIQKTFFGLGSTLFALLFAAFFAKLDEEGKDIGSNFEGYLLLVLGLAIVSGLLCTFVTRLPGYKRTNRELKQQALLSSGKKRAAKRFEEREFEKYHNPRMSDTARLNYGVTNLAIILVFLSIFSLTKTYVKIPHNVMDGICIAALLLMANFFFMIWPWDNFPKLFEYSCAPSIHPPEETEPPATAKGLPVEHDITTTAHNFLAAEPGDEKQIQRGNEVSEGSEESDTEEDVQTKQDTENREEEPLIRHSNASSRSSVIEDGDNRRPSVYGNLRASVAGGNEINVPTAIDPMVIPALQNKFTKSLKEFPLWGLWIVTFSAAGGCSMFSNNTAEIVHSVTGNRDTRPRDLAIAIYGIGSALGRIFIGSAERFIHKRNAIRREKQLLYLAREKQGLIKPDEPQEDLSPIFQRWDASVTVLLAIPPICLFLGNFILIFLNSASSVIVFIPFLFAGFSQGSSVASSILTVKEVYCVDVAKHYNFLSSAGIPSSILLNVVLFGKWYDYERNKHEEEQFTIDFTNSTNQSDSLCFSPDCIRNPMIINGVLSFLCIAIAVYIFFWWYRIRKASHL